LLAMSMDCSLSRYKCASKLYLSHLYGFLAPRAYSVIMLGALFCTLAAKLFHCLRIGSTSGEYFGWIFADIAVLLGIEVILAAACFCRPRKWIIRIAVVVAAVICTWSVVNAGWLIRTGTQVLPCVLLPLIRDPLSSLGMIGVNLIRMPAAAVALLGPSAVALTFFFFVLVRPRSLDSSRKRFVIKVLVSLVIVFVTAVAHSATVKQSSAQIASAGLWHNCQLEAVAGSLADSARLNRADLAKIKREIPTLDQIQAARSSEPGRPAYNLVVVVLEGVQYRYTSLYDKKSGLTPYLANLAARGAEFANARSSLTHTTKALFALLTGRFPSAYQDIAEAVPAAQPYAGVASILKHKLNFRTAFFLSGKGQFECGPGLVYNLGFDKFFAREDLGDSRAFVGYMSGDEFAMLPPIVEWIKADERPFFLTFMCSVTHDPYEVPRWFAEPAKELVDRYRQTISYTDKFLAALDAELNKLNLADKTILCVISDHGEGFGEHGLFAHEAIPFDEALRIPWVIRAPALIEPATRVTEPVCSVDLTPTLLALLGFDTGTFDFDGINALAPIPNGRKVFFTSWMQYSPAGYVKGGLKFIYTPTTQTVSVYDLIADPFEHVGTELHQQQAQEIAAEIIDWQRNSVFRVNQQLSGEKTLFDHWHCNWHKRIAWADYR